MKVCVVYFRVGIAFCCVEVVYWLLHKAYVSGVCRVDISNVCSILYVGDHVWLGCSI